jgi:hypothetical protein
MDRKALIGAAILLMGLPINGSAQKFEVAPYVGYRFGGKFTNVNDPNNSLVNTLKVENSFAFGLIADFFVTPAVAIEGSFAYQPTQMKADIPNMPFELFDLKVTWYQIGLRFETPRQDEPKPRGFLSVTGGATSLMASDNGTETKPSFGFSLGGEYFFSKNVGVVLLGRYMGTFFNSNDQFFCPEVGGDCLQLPSSTTMHQAEISGGVVLAF